MSLGRDWVCVTQSGKGDPVSQLGICGERSLWEAVSEHRVRGFLDLTGQLLSKRHDRRQGHSIPWVLRVAGGR